MLWQTEGRIPNIETRVREGRELGFTSWYRGALALMLPRLSYLYRQGGSGDGSTRGAGSSVASRQCLGGGILCCGKVSLCLSVSLSQCWLSLEYKIKKVQSSRGLRARRRKLGLGTATRQTSGLDVQVRLKSTKSTERETIGLHLVSVDEITVLFSSMGFYFLFISLFHLSSFAVVRVDNMVPYL